MDIYLLLNHAKTTKPISMWWTQIAKTHKLLYIPVSAPSERSSRRALVFNILQIIIYLAHFLDLSMVTIEQIRIELCLLRLTRVE